MVGNFNTLGFSVSVSSLVSLEKSDLYHTKKLLTLVELKFYSRKIWDVVTDCRIAINSDLAGI